VWSVATVMLLVVVGGIVSGVLAVRARAATVRATDAEGRTRAALDDSRYQLARLAVQRGDWATAAETYRRAIADNTRYPVEARLGLIRALQNSGQKPVAVRELEALVRDFPAEADRPDVLYWRGQVAWLTREAEAEKYFEAAFRPGPGRRPLDRADEMYARGVLSTDLYESIGRFREALDHDMFHYDARVSLFCTLLFLGDFDEATRQCELWRRLFPGDVMADVGQAMIHALAGRPEQADRGLTALAGRLDPKAVGLLRDLLAIVRDFHEMPPGPVDVPRTMGLAARVMSITQAYDGTTGLTLLQFPRGMRRLIQPALELAKYSNPIAALLPDHKKNRERAIAEFARAYPTNATFTVYGMERLNGGDLVQAEKLFRRATTAPSIIDYRPQAALHLLHVQAIIMANTPKERREPMLAEFRRTVRLTLNIGGFMSTHDDMNRRVVIGDCRLFGLEAEAREFLAQWQAACPPPKDVAPRLTRAAFEFDIGNYTAALLQVDALLKDHPDAAIYKLSGAYLRGEILKEIHRIGLPGRSKPIEEYLKETAAAAATRPAAMRPAATLPATPAKS
jgi:tetratricopeptide (TPR) repeat protein